jgi:hypothetical protein
MIVPTRNPERAAVVAILNGTLIPFPASMLALFVALLAALRATFRFRLELEEEILAHPHQPPVLQRQAPKRLLRRDGGAVPRFRRRKYPRRIQTPISDPPGVGNSDRAVEPESSETLGISREMRWLLR